MLEFNSTEDKIKIECLHRWIGQCKNCQRDFDPNHHPNNLECRAYKVAKIFYVEERTYEQQYKTE